MYFYLKKQNDNYKMSKNHNFLMQVIQIVD